MPQGPDIYTRWSMEMRRIEFFHPGERVGVAVSGGPDSVLLLDFMKQLAREVGLHLAIVHFNHHLRGAESDADERFVRELARELAIEFIRGEGDVAQVAREKHRNLEATARDLRYRFFFSLINHSRLDKVTTGHTANDQAETVLLRLLRGAGTRGLGGIYPVLEGKVVRPFLNLTRAEIESELRKRKLDFRVDSTNRNPALMRTKVRTELLPLLQREFNPAVITLFKELSDRARDDEAYLEQQAWERSHPWRVREGAEEKIPLRPLVEFPPAIARRVLRQMIVAARGSLRGVTYLHIEALCRFAAEAQSGRRLTLPGGLGARKEFDWLVIGPRFPGPEGSEFAYAVEVPGEVSVPQLGLTFGFKIVGQDDFRQAYNRLGVVSLDPLKLSGGLVLRNWRTGDRFRPLGSGKLWKLKELFRQHKIPFGQRSRWPLLESGREVVWVRGLPPASSVAASPTSKQVMIIGEQPYRPAGAHAERR